MALSEVLQYGRTVVADRSQLDPMLPKSLFRILQLHELRFAERSPIRGPEEKKNRSVGFAQCVIWRGIAKLIVRCEGRRVLSNVQSDSGRNGRLA